MHTIIPACIPASAEALHAFLREYSKVSDELQIDIVDGKFVPSMSWPYMEEDIEAELRHTDFRAYKVELDLMIEDPLSTLDLWLYARPSMIVVHVESVSNLDDVIAHAGTHAYRLGLAFNNDTDLSVLETVDISCVDYVQLMGIAEIGKQGQPFDTRVLARIREMNERFPNLPVSVDGSVNEDTIVSLREAGARRFVVGSALMHAQHKQEKYTELLRRAGGV